MAEPTGGAPGAAAPAATVPAAPAPQRRDAGWRWPLPPARYTREEDIPADRIRAVAAAAAGTLRQVSHGGLGGRPVGARMLREALLDHIPVTVINADGERIEVPQRLVSGGPDGFPGTGRHRGERAAGRPLGGAGRALR